MKGFYVMGGLSVSTGITSGTLTIFAVLQQLSPEVVQMVLGIAAVMAAVSFGAGWKLHGWYIAIRDGARAEVKAIAADVTERLDEMERKMERRDDG